MFTTPNLLVSVLRAAQDGLRLVTKIPDPAFLHVEGGGREAKPPELFTPLRLF